MANFAVKNGETDILISAERDLTAEADTLIKRYRADIINYIKTHPEFKTSLNPIDASPDAPDIIKSMLRASRLADVGPMASVAGAISEFTGRGLLEFTRQVILENGGDIFIKTDKERKVAVYAGRSPLSGRIAVTVEPAKTPLGICTSSGTVGHSLSFGKADAVSVMARDAALADACATAACNMIKAEKDIEKALRFAKGIEGVMGCVVIYKRKIGSIGEIKLARGDIK